jgi:hypothetical protein
MIRNVTKKLKKTTMAEQIRALEPMGVHCNRALRRICRTGDQALLLSQIVLYWFGRGEDGRLRARFQRKGQDGPWAVMTYPRWGHEIGVDEQQARRSIEALEKRGFIRVDRARNKRGTAVQPCKAAILQAIKQLPSIPTRGHKRPDVDSEKESDAGESQLSN